MIFFVREWIIDGIHDCASIMGSKRSANSAHRIAHTYVVSAETRTREMLIFGTTALIQGARPKLLAVCMHMTPAPICPEPFLPGPGVV